MDHTAQWPQGIGVVQVLPMEGPARAVAAAVERKPRPQKEQALNCPRCNSTNTKFCYYNNYSLSQPRYFCKTCRRYWTEGGSLRNVPVGGGSRKNKRSTSTSAAASLPSSNKVPDLINSPRSTAFPSHSASQNPKIQDGQDLNLAYPPAAYGGGISEFADQIPYGGESKAFLGNPNSSSRHHDHHQVPLPMEFLKPGIGFMSLPISDSNAIYSSAGIPAPGFKFSPEAFETAGYGGLQETASAPRLFSHLEDLRQVSSTSSAADQFEQHQHQQSRGQRGESNGHWNGMLGGGGTSW